MELQPITVTTQWVHDYLIIFMAVTICDHAIKTSQGLWVVFTNIATVTRIIIPCKYETVTYFSQIWTRIILYFWTLCIEVENMIWSDQLRKCTGYESPADQVFNSFSRLNSATIWIAKTIILWKWEKLTLIFTSLITDFIIRVVVILLNFVH